MTRSRQLSALPVVLAAAALALGACGTSSAGATPAAAATAQPAASPAGDATSTTLDRAARQAAMQAYVQCMATNGVVLNLPSRGTTPDGSAPQGSFPPGSFPNGGFRPGGSTPPAGVDQATYDKALAACKDKLPAGGFGGGRGGGRSNNAAYVQCMRDNGVNLPTPPTTVPGGTFPPTTTDPTASTIDRTSATYRAAATKCSVLLGNGNGAGSTATSTAVPSTTAG